MSAEQRQVFAAICAVTFASAKSAVAHLLEVRGS